MMAGTKSGTTAVRRFTLGQSRAGKFHNSGIVRTGVVALVLVCGLVTGSAQITKPNIVVSQTTLLAGFPSGGALSGGSPAGTSMTVNSLGNLILSTSYGGHIAQFNGQTGAVTDLGAYNNPGPVAVDAANNLYIADVFDTTITKVPFVSGAYVALSTPSGSTPVCTGTDTAECTLPSLTSGIYGYASMTFDAAGNLYVTSTNGGTHANSIFRCSTTCLTASSPAATLIYQEATSASAQLYVGGIAVDSSGDIFFTDSATNTSNATSTASNLKEIVKVGAGYATTPLTLYAYTVGSPAAYDNQLDGVAVDANAVYFATEFDGIYAFPNNNGVVSVAQMYTASTQGAKILTSDGNDHFFAAAYSNSTGGDAAFKINIGNAFVGSALLGNTVTATNALTILNDVTGCSGSPSVTFSYPTTEFAAATSGSCSSTNITSASAFATSLTFKPAGAGTRSGTLTATDSLNNTGTAAISGTGVGSPAATPTFNPMGGTYTSAQSVTISDATANASIFYTTDGSTPTTSSTPYTGAIAVTASETIKAIATGPANGASSVGTAIYTLNLPAGTPTFSPTPTTYNAVQHVTISTTTPGATIYYTTDGSTPTTSSSVYSTALTVGATETIQAIATAPGFSVSAVGSALYVINLPTFNLAVNPASINVSRGGQVLTNVTIQPLNGFLGTVQLACSGLPTGYSCSFTPATLTPTSNYSVTSVLAVNVSATSSMLDPAPGIHPFLQGTALALVLGFFGLRKRRGVRLVLLMGLGFLGMTIMTGCSSGTSTASPKTGMLTVTATSGTIQKTATVTVVVQ